MRVPGRYELYGRLLAGDLTKAESEADLWQIRFNPLPPTIAVKPRLNSTLQLRSVRGHMG